MTELQWITTDKERWNYLFAQVYGNACAEAIQEFLVTGHTIDAESLVNQCMKLTDVALVLINERFAEK